VEFEKLIYLVKLSKSLMFFTVFAFCVVFVLLMLLFLAYFDLVLFHFFHLFHLFHLFLDSFIYTRLRMYKNTVIYPLVLAEVVNKTRPKEDEHEPVNIAIKLLFQEDTF